jgi:hypothetical protein
VTPNDAIRLASAIVALVLFALILNRRREGRDAALKRMAAHHNKTADGSQAPNLPEPLR